MLNVTTRHVDVPFPELSSFVGRFVLRVGRMINLLVNAGYRMNIAVNQNFACVIPAGVEILYLQR